MRFTLPGREKRRRIGNAAPRSEHDPDDRELKKKSGVVLALENAIVMMAVLLVTAQLVVVSSRCRQTMIRPSSPR